MYLGYTRCPASAKSARRPTAAAPAQACRRRRSPTEALSGAGVGQAVKFKDQPQDVAVELPCEIRHMWIGSSRPAHSRGIRAEHGAHPRLRELAHGHGFYRFMCAFEDGFRIGVLRKGAASVSDMMRGAPGASSPARRLHPWTARRRAPRQSLIALKLLTHTARSPLARGHCLENRIRRTPDNQWRRHATLQKNDRPARPIALCRSRHRAGRRLAHPSPGLYIRY